MVIILIEWRIVDVDERKYEEEQEDEYLLTGQVELVVWSVRSSSV